MLTVTDPITQKLSFEQFIKQCPDEGRYELVNGEIFEVVNTRQHKDIAESLLFLFQLEIKRLNLPYRATTQAVIRTVTKNGSERGRIPDVSLIDLDKWRDDRSDYGAFKEAIPLAVEVTSTNWDDDYIDKLYEYEQLGVREYWIVDYLAIASREFLGNPKLPTISIYDLNSAKKYKLSKFQGNETIISKLLPELKITAAEILQA